MLSPSANAHDVGSDLVDRVYVRYGTYADHLRRLDDVDDVDPLDAFIDRTQGDEASGETPPDALYEAYHDYCEREGLVPLDRASVLGAAHRLPNPSNSAPQVFRRLSADDLRGVASAHLREHAFKLPGKSLLEGFDKRSRCPGVDGVEGHDHINERLVEQGVGDARRQGVEASLVVAHRNLNVLSLKRWRMLRAGSRLRHASQRILSHRLPAFANGLGAEVRALRDDFAFARTVALPEAVALFRADRALQVALALYVVGMPLAIAALCGVRL